MKNQIANIRKQFDLSPKNNLFLVFTIAIIISLAFVLIQQSYRASYSRGKSIILATSFRHISDKTPCKINVGIDAGHGGILNNQYLTSGKQSPQWPDGLKIYEGYSNKLLASMLQTSLLENDIDAFMINSEAYDYTNLIRAERINTWLKLDNRIILLSLHHNAQPTDYADYTDKFGIKGYYKNGGASGIEVFTSVGQTKSDLIADFIISEIQNEFPEITLRTDKKDGDKDKEANFTVLAASNSPAVLIEFMFMTTYTDCLIIADPAYRQRFVSAITRAYVKYNQSLLK